jgi:hypothetical protein
MYARQAYYIYPACLQKKRQEDVMEFFFERLDVRGGGRIRLPEGTVSIGRSPKSTIVLSADERCVSGIHAVVYSDPRRLLLQDMHSTNGTFVNGRQVQECVLEDGDEVRLGRSGPRFRVVGGGVAEVKGFDINAAAGGMSAPFVGGVGGIDGVGGNVGIDNLGGIDDDYSGGDDDVDIDLGMGVDVGAHQEPSNTPAVRESRSRVRVIGIIAAAAVFVIIGLLAFSALTSAPAKTKARPDKKQFFSPGEGGPSEQSSSRISTDIDVDEADAARTSPAIFSASTVDKINSVLIRFGETDYRAPPEMVERVEHYLSQYTGRMRRTIAMYMERSKQYFPMIRRVFEEKNIPLELAYVSMLESGFNTTAVSHAGAVGLWQFMPHTARRYGLHVSGNIDERTDPEKATYAAAAYFRHLIAIFGSRSSVMLCMAAYNAGEQRIINALKRIDDPMRNRDFWYLYRMGWLAEETNEYIPQVIALIIVSENLAEYGFEE